MAERRTGFCHAGVGVPVAMMVAAVTLVGNPVSADAALFISRCDLLAKVWLGRSWESYS